ncbi:MAG: organomercurial lyase [Thermoplasmata archaeon]
MRQAFEEESPKMTETDGEALTLELGRRLKRVYGLPREPTSIEDYYALVEEGSQANPQMEAYLQKMRKGQVVMGETAADRGYAVTIPERGKVNVMCGYDAVLTAVVRGEGRAEGACPHCGEAMDVRVEGGNLAHASPDSIVFWLGTGPPGGPGHPVCDHLHLFPSREHLLAWVEGQPDELGFEVPLATLVERLNTN